MNMQRGSKVSFILQETGLERGDWGPASGPGTVKLGFLLGIYKHCHVMRNQAV